MQRLARRWRAKSRLARLALVPTMGYLHAGHISLVRRARSRVGPHGKVVVSIYVNPTQFGPAEDFSRYPRDLRHDLRLCREAGVDAVFAPSDEAMYPGRTAGRLGFSTCVVEEVLSRTMEGASRPTHFRGVTTVVAKLFNIVLPDMAVFGAKDFQQAAVIRRMTADLNFPVKILVAPTLREADGLAMSSRNKYLKGALRQQATVLRRAIDQARRSIKGSAHPIPGSRLRAALRRLIESEPDARVDYIEFFDPESLEPVAKLERGVHMALAVRIGQTRLIDNGRL